MPTELGSSPVNSGNYLISCRRKKNPAYFIDPNGGKNPGGNAVRFYSSERGQNSRTLASTKGEMESTWSRPQMMALSTNRKALWAKGNRAVQIRASNGDDIEELQKKRLRNKQDRSQAARDFRVISIAVSALFAGLAVFLRYQDADLFLDEDFNLDAVPVIAGLLLAISFQYSSPYQLLIVFFGRFETERPVDWVADRLAGKGGGAGESDAVAPSQSTTAAMKAASAALIGAGGVTLAALISKYVGDTWALSLAIGTGFFSFLYEVGRPRQLNADETAAREEAWGDFEVFAETSLVRAGSCHESEIMAAFVREYPKYKDESEGEQARKQMRRFVSRWNPYAERTPYGFFKNVAFSSAFKEGMTKSL
eukprot:jgi/Bigna1/144813/aug1.91_g19521